MLHESSYDLGKVLYYEHRRFFELILLCRLRCWRPCVGGGLEFNLLMWFEGDMVGSVILMSILAQNLSGSACLAWREQRKRLRSRPTHIDRNEIDHSDEHHVLLYSLLELSLIAQEIALCRACIAELLLEVAGLLGSDILL